MTIFTSDVSHHDYDRGAINWASVRGAGIEVAIAKATEGDPGGYHYADPSFVRAVTDARAGGVALMGGYHCIAAGDQGSINRQVDFLVGRANEVGGVAKGWWMLDIEPFSELKSRGMAPRLQDVLAFEARWHQVTGGYPLAHYLPHWVWESWGSPNLTGIQGPLISSNYPVSASQSFTTLYSRDGGDKGPGWAAYGGKTPALWQFASTNQIPGITGNCDCNAYKGSLTDLIKLLAGHTSAPPPSNHPTLLAVDGQLGPLTIRRWQQAMGTIQDGVISQPPGKSSLVMAVQRKLNSAIHAKLKVDGVGIRQDGHSVFETTKALQRYLHTTVDGMLSTPVSQAVKALQAKLNSGGF